MIEISINLDNPNDILEFVSVLEKYDFDADLRNWHKFEVDARSILGIMSMDLSKSLVLTIHEAPGSVVNKFLSDIRKFLMEGENDWF